MIVETKSTPIIREGTSNESLFNIKKENVAHIFSILRNQLYSDKILAVIREYSTNAMDAHVEDKVERPFEITLPTPFNPEFVIRDFGRGLSQEEIVDIFASYGESTKRSSNSFTGMLGLGSKSAFAYTNSFVVKSRHNGVEYTYSAFIDETNVGAITLVNQTPSTETGLSIHINVKASDCRIFEDRCKSFFKHCTMMPKFTNNTSIIESFEKLPVPSMTGKDWKIYQNYGDSVVHMGNVAYTIPHQMFNDLFTVEQSKVVKGFRAYNGWMSGEWHIFAPIGSVKPSASRESLEFNDATKKYIGTKIYEICIEIHSRLVEEFNKKKSDWEKRIFAFEMSKLMQSLPLQMIPYCVPYTEKDLSPLGISKVKYERFVGRFSDDKHPNIAPQKNVIYFLDSPSITRISVKPRIEHYITENKITSKPLAYYSPTNESDVKSSAIISFKTDEEKEKFKKNKTFLGMEFVDLAVVSYDPKKKQSNPNALKGDVGELFVFHPNEYYNLKKWKATESRPKKIVYVEISNFMPKEYGKDNSELSAILDLMRKDFLSLNEDLVICGVKSANIKNVGSDWIELKDYFKNKIEEFKTKHKAEYDAYCRFDNLNSFWKSFICNEYSYDFNYKTYDPKNYKLPEYLYEPFKPIFLEYCMYRSHVSKFSNIAKTCRFLEIEFFKEQQIEEIEKLKKDIPILSVFSHTSIPYENLHKKITELL